MLVLQVVARPTGRVDQVRVGEIRRPETEVDVTRLVNRHPQRVDRDRQYVPAGGDDEFLVSLAVPVPVEDQRDLPL